MQTQATGRSINVYIYANFKEFGSTCLGTSKNKSVLIERADPVGGDDLQLYFSLYCLDLRSQIMYIPTFIESSAV